MSIVRLPLSANFNPSWMDFPMFYRANPAEIRPNMVFCAHMIFMHPTAARR